jgi:hypothetical protein
MDAQAVKPPAFLPMYMLLLGCDVGNLDHCR